MAVFPFSSSHVSIRISSSYVYTCTYELFYYYTSRLGADSPLRNGRREKIPVSTCVHTPNSSIAHVHQHLNTYRSVRCDGQVTCLMIRSFWRRDYTLISRSGDHLCNNHFIFSLPQFFYVTASLDAGRYLGTEIFPAI